MSLNCVTKNNESSKGKPGIYIAAHPEDKVEFVEQFGESVPGCLDCAIYYNLDTDGCISNHENDLAKMVLFVVPVTDRLLNQPSLARDTEIPFALTHHVPVLPYFNETALEEQFIQFFYGSKSGNANADLSGKQELDNFIMETSSKNPNAIKAYEIGENIKVFG